MNVVHAGHVEVPSLVVAMATRAGFDIRRNLIGMMSPRGFVTFAALGVGLLMDVFRRVSGER